MSITQLKTHKVESISTVSYFNVPNYFNIRNISIKKYMQIINNWLGLIILISNFPHLFN